MHESFIRKPDYYDFRSRGTINPNNSKKKKWICTFQTSGRCFELKISLEKKKIPFKFPPGVKEDKSSGRHTGFQISL